MRDVARDAEETDGLGESSFVEEIHAETETKLLSTVSRSNAENKKKDWL